MKEQSIIKSNKERNTIGDIKSKSDHLSNKGS